MHPLLKRLAVHSMQLGPFHKISLLPIALVEGQVKCQGLNSFGHRLATGCLLRTPPGAAFLPAAQGIAAHQLVQPGFVRSRNLSPIGTHLEVSFH